ncbi:hypothetical protein EJ04DRAFT_574308 [Polyplosphaeria fusca]|uniref:Uncharacterized protein n=1 Tax=Polyplosphaeria fusca TaxID=682080 RepID=A0A9P4R6W8_9PLEO|nr:hypothetical protein EJ04DRAFT_574308 [Polyplosphaeria fusca]
MSRDCAVSIGSSDHSLNRGLHSKIYWPGNHRRPQAYYSSLSRNQTHYALTMAPNYSLTQNLDDDALDNSGLAEFLGEMKTPSPPSPKSTLSQAVLNTVRGPVRSSSNLSNRSSQGKSRSSSRSSQRLNSEKLKIHKDNVADTHQRKNRSQDRNIKPARSSRTPSVPKLDSRSKSDSAVIQVKPAPLDDREETTHTRDDIVVELYHISTERSKLIEQLYALDTQEKALLHALQQTISTIPANPSILSDENAPTPVPPSLCTKKPILIPSPVTELSPEDPDAPNRASLPNRSTTTLQHRTPLTRTIKCIPLSDKTSASIAAFDSTPTFISPGWDVTPAKSPSPNTCAVEQAGEDGEEGIEGERKGVRVLVDFGGGGKVARIPGWRKEYEVPRTVERKRWDF